MDMTSTRWSALAAHEWFHRQPLPLGANFLPANAINQLALWQDLDEARIALELGWAADLGMNMMRVFLHDALWRADAADFKRRIDRFLDIASRHGIRAMFVLFDSCWSPVHALGPQRPPIPGVHNSGWVQGPGAEILGDHERHVDSLKAYVTDIVGHFAQDARVAVWDVWNEPDNGGGGFGFYDKVETPRKFAAVDALLPQVFAWARSVAPSQPLTSGVWIGDDWALASTTLNSIQRTQLEQSDVTSFHDYSWPEKFEARIRQLQTWGRPLLCTEYMARGLGSVFDGALPVAARHRVGMINWGFVDGLSQTKFPWDSWVRPYNQMPVGVWHWFHDILHPDGTPYREQELACLRAFARETRT